MFCFAGGSGCCASECSLFFFSPALGPVWANTEEMSKTLMFGAVERRRKNGGSGSPRICLVFGLIVLVARASVSKYLLITLVSQ